MSLFTSNRERRLWLWTLVAVLGIYATLGLAQTMAGALRDRGLITAAFNVGLFLIAAAVVVHGLRTRPALFEVAIVAGIAAIYLMVMLRMVVPEERSHLIEYSIVALLIFEALRERKKQGKHVPVPALLAIGGTTLIGIIDECLQFFIPNRVFDWFDILFDFLASVMAVSGSQVLAWARQRFTKKERSA